MFEITVAGRFTAIHQIQLPDGSLEAAHEHEWHVRITYSGAALDSNGLLFDFSTVRGWLNRLLASLDKQMLNQVPAFAHRNPSAENLAVFIADALPGDLPGFARLKAVEVEEEPGCIARYFPPG